MSQTDNVNKIWRLWRGSMDWLQRNVGEDWIEAKEKQNGKVRAAQSHCKSGEKEKKWEEDEAGWKQSKSGARSARQQRPQRMKERLQLKMTEGKSGANVVTDLERGREWKQRRMGFVQHENTHQDLNVEQPFCHKASILTLRPLLTDQTENDKMTLNTNLWYNILNWGLGICPSSATEIAS